MRALTLIRPMSAAIVHGSKRIENRPRDLPAKMRGVPTIVAVHAGKKWSEEYERVIHEIDGSWKDEHLSTGFHAAHYKVARYTSQMSDEGIVGLMRLTGRVFTHREVEVYNSPMRDNNNRDYVREYLLDGMLTRQSDWYSGPYGYEIDRAVAFETPVPCRGMQGFWPAPEGLLGALICGACGWHHPNGEPITGCVMR